MRLYVAAGALLAIVLLIYLPDVGHGFIKDDFGWVAHSRVDSPDDVAGLFSRNVGFFRPLVSATFLLDHAIWGLNPFGYGLTNLLLFLLDAGLLFCLSRRLQLAADVALFATALWAFNFHAVNMALLWISGRTALLMIAFALATAMAALRGRTIVTGLCALLAMLCKEEAVLLPVFLSGLVYLNSPRLSHSRLNASTIVSVVTRTWPAWLALGIYLGLRANSGAFWIQNAPSYYQLSIEPALLLRNFLEYLDREATVAVGAILALWLFARRARISLNVEEKKAAAFGAVWLVSFNALTIFLPIRSDLYALAPSIGAVLIAASVASALRRSTAVSFSTAWAALTILALLASPVYRVRNERWVAEADLSARVMRTVALTTEGTPSGRVTLIDDASARPNLDSSIGSLFGEAVLLFLGPSWNGAVVASSDAGDVRKETASFVLRLRDGQLVEEQPH